MSILAWHVLFCTCTVTYYLLSFIWRVLYSFILYMLADDFVLNYLVNVFFRICWCTTSLAMLLWPLVTTLHERSFCQDPMLSLIVRFELFDLHVLLSRLVASVSSSSFLVHSPHDVCSHSNPYTRIHPRLPRRLLVALATSLAAISFIPLVDAFQSHTLSCTGLPLGLRREHFLTKDKIFTMNAASDYNLTWPGMHNETLYPHI